MLPWLRCWLSGLFVAALLLVLPARTFAQPTPRLDTREKDFADYWQEANASLLTPLARRRLANGYARLSFSSTLRPVRYELVAAANAARLVSPLELLCLNRANGSMRLECRLPAETTRRIIPLSAGTCRTTPLPPLERLLPSGCAHPYVITIEGRPVTVRNAAVEQDTGQTPAAPTMPALIPQAAAPNRQEPDLAPPPAQPPAPPTGPPQATENDRLVRENQRLARQNARLKRIMGGGGALLLMLWIAFSLARKAWRMRRDPSDASPSQESRLEGNGIQTAAVLEALTAEYAAQTQRIEALAAERAAANARADSAEKAFEEANAQLGARSAELAVKTAELSAAHRRADEAAAKAGSQERRLDELQQAHRQACGERDAAHRRLAEEQAKAARLEEQLAQRPSMTPVDQQPHLVQLAHAHEAAEAAHAETETLRKALAAQTATFAAERQALQDRLAEQTFEAGELRAKLELLQNAPEGTRPSLPNTGTPRPAPALHPVRTTTPFGEPKIPSRVAEVPRHPLQSGIQTTAEAQTERRPVLAEETGFLEGTPDGFLDFNDLAEAGEESPTAQENTETTGVIVRPQELRLAIVPPAAARPPDGETREHPACMALASETTRGSKDKIFREKTRKMQAAEVDEQLERKRRLSEEGSLGQRADDPNRTHDPPTSPNTGREAAN